MDDVRQGTIYKALSGFYYVRSGDETVECKARGRFRLDKISPLVGDNVEFSVNASGGYIQSILPRRNWFVRPQVANIDAMVVIASNVIPVTDPFLVDRVTVIAEEKNCEVIICVNKTDMDTGDELYEIYRNAGYTTIRTSAKTGEGIAELAKVTAGKVCAFTGNSGVGKSSILNAMQPGLVIKTGDVSEKLGRGRHTTRHVELFTLDTGAIIADTPGFSSFEIEDIEVTLKDDLQYAFPDFHEYINSCRYTGCSHTKERGCAVKDAVEQGKIVRSRYDSYLRLYEKASAIKEWELKDRVKHSEK